MFNQHRSNGKGKVHVTIYMYMHMYIVYRKMGRLSRQVNYVNIITGYGSTLYIGIAMVFVFELVITVWYIVYRKTRRLSSCVNYIIVLRC